MTRHQTPKLTLKEATTLPSEFMRQHVNNVPTMCPKCVKNVSTMCPQTFRRTFQALKITLCHHSTSNFENKTGVPRILNCLETNLSFFAIYISPATAISIYLSLPVPGYKERKINFSLMIIILLRLYAKKHTLAYIFSAAPAPFDN